LKNFSLLVAVILLLSFILPTAWAVPLETDLNHYWKFDGNYYGQPNPDYVTFNNFNSIVGLLRYYPGIINNAAFFDRSNIYSGPFGYIGSNTLGQFSGDFTINLWVKDGDLNRFTDQYYFNKYCALSSMGTTMGWCIGRQKDGNIFFGAGYGRSLGDGNIIYSNTPPTYNAWHMYTGTRSGGTFTLYIDGVLNKSTAFPVGITLNSFNFPIIGASLGDSNSNNLDGNLDEMGLWTRALSVADVNSLYNNGIGKSYCPAVPGFTDGNSCNLYGQATFRLKDEKTWADLTGVDITINGTLITTTTAGTTIVDFSSIPFGNTTVTFSKTNYTTRSYQFDYNGTNTDQNIILNLTSTSILNGFKFKIPALNAYATNTYVTIYKLEPVTNSIFSIGQYLTDGTGATSIYVDNNQQQYYTTFSFGGHTYLINPIVLTINNPKDEMTYITIAANFNLSFTNAFSYFYGDQNVPVAFYVIPNTTNTIDMYVDSNNLLYSGRSYSFIFTSDSISTTFTPYLPLTSMTGGNVNFITRTKTRDTLPYVDFKIFKVIGGLLTQVEAGRTDVTGSRLFNFIDGANYSIEVSYNGKLIESAYLYTATATPVYWYIDINSNDIEVQEYFIPVFVTFTPTGPQLTGLDTSIVINMSANNLNHYTYQIYQYNDLNMMTGKKIQASGAAGCAGSTCSATILLPLMDTNKSFFVDINIFYNGGLSMYNVTHVYSKTAKSNLDVFVLARAVRTDFGCSLDPNTVCSLGILVSVVLTLIGIFALARITGMFFGNGTLVIAMLALGLFTYVNWFYWPLYIFLVIGAVFAASSGFVRGGA